MLKKMNLEGIFYLSDSIKVDNFEEGCKKYGGCTSFFDGKFMLCGVEKSKEFILDVCKNYVLALYIPSTLDVDGVIDNTPYVEKYTKKLREFYKEQVVKIDAIGGWVCENGELVKEKVTTLNLCANLSEEGFYKLIEFAREVKEEMKQEGVTITINRSFLIV